MYLTMEQRYTRSPQEPMMEQRFTCILCWILHWSRTIPKGGLDPVGSLCWSRILAGPMEPWREELTQSRFLV